MTANEQSRFPEGTFTPQPKQASIRQIVLAQTKMESLLFLRHGEQQLLSLVIPIAMLVGLTFLPFVSVTDPLARAFPMTLAVAVLSAGFTGQAILVAFDRRYGALKRIGASALPKWAIIVGKACAVTVVVLIQVIILTSIALLLGWHSTILGSLIALFFLVLGTATFTALGLLLGGTLGSEMVLALGNFIWLVFMAAAGVVAMDGNMREGVHAILMLIPSVALTQGLFDAFTGTVNIFAIVVLLFWGAVGVTAAVKMFRFSS